MSELETRYEAKIDEVQGIEQSLLKERLNTDCSLADFLAEEWEAGNFDQVISKLKECHTIWLTRKLAEVNPDPKKIYRFCLDIAEEFEWFMTGDEYEKYKRELIQIAIDNDYSIIRE